MSLVYESRGRGFESYSGHFHSEKLSYRQTWKILWSFRCCWGVDWEVIGFEWVRFSQIHFDWLETFLGRGSTVQECLFLWGTGFYYQPYRRKQKWFFLLIRLVRQRGNEQDKWYNSLPFYEKIKIAKEAPIGQFIQSICKKFIQICKIYTKTE